MQYGNQKNEPNNAEDPNSKIMEYLFANQLIPLPNTLLSMMATRCRRRMALRIELPRAKRAVIILLLQMLVVWGVDFEDGA
jgi:hypothetical protein